MKDRDILALLLVLPEMFKGLSDVLIWILEKSKKMNDYDVTYAKQVNSLGQKTNMTF